MKTQTLLVISAAVTAVLTLPVENYASYGHNGSVLTFPCGDNVPYWIAEIGFGTPAQKSPLLIDTSSDSTWTAGVKCHDEFCTSRKDPLYNAGKSSTSKNLHQQVHLDYGNGKVVESDLYTDNLQFGNVCIEDYKFGKAFSVQGFDCNVGYSGIWGLGGSLDDIAKRSLLNKRGDRKGVASFDPEPRGFRKRNNVGKMCGLSFGINRNAYIGDIAWLDIPTCDYGASPFWKTKLTCVKIDGVVDFKFNNTLASFDTSVKYIEAPHDDVAKIHEGLGATYNENSKQYEFDCCNAKDLKFSFEKYDITIPVSAWTSPTDHSGKTCTVKLSVSKSDLEPINKWQLGTSFIENFYSIFNYDSLQTGLALSVNGLEGLKITSK